MVRIKSNTNLSFIIVSGTRRLLWGELPQFERDFVLGDTEECER